MKPKFYDTRGIIPKPRENLQSYVERARRDLDFLQQVGNDIKEKRAGDILTRETKINDLFTIGQYEVIDNPLMREYGFSVLPFLTLAIDSNIYIKSFEESDSINIAAQYKGRRIPLTFIPYEGRLEKVLSESKRDSIKHEIIHGIRRFAEIAQTRHFEELIAYTVYPQKENPLGYYFLGWARRGFSLLPDSRIERAVHDYLKETVSKGIAKKFPLPLLVRIDFEEFKDLVRQKEAGKKISRAVKEKAGGKPDHAWRWQLIAELCGY